MDQGMTIAASGFVLEFDGLWVKHMCDIQSRVFSLFPLCFMHSPRLYTIMGWSPTRRNWRRMCDGGMPRSCETWKS